jgi:hypothetical protein
MGKDHMPCLIFATEAVFDYPVMQLKRVLWLSDRRRKILQLRERLSGSQKDSLHSISVQRISPTRAEGLSVLGCLDVVHCYVWEA